MGALVHRLLLTRSTGLRAAGSEGDGQDDGDEQGIVARSLELRAVVVIDVYQ